jgi:phosphoglucomutase
VTEAVYARTQVIDRWLTVDAEDVDLDTCGSCAVADTIVSIIDPVADYADLMETLFDFGAIRQAVAAASPWRSTR